MAKKTIFCLTLLFAHILPLVQGEEYEPPPPEAWKGLFNKPGMVRSEVSREIEEDKSKWIDAYAELHVCTDIPMASLRETILDYAIYPQIFKRNKGMDVVYEDGKVYHDMVAGIEVFGVAYTMWFRQQVTVVIDEPDRLLLDFSHVADDGRVKDVRGAWYFESLPGTDWTYVRYYGASRVVQRFPLQRFIMSILIDGETKDALVQFLAAARKRNS